MNKLNKQNRVAILDLGTNTLKLLIADRVGDSWNYIQDLAIPCRLGEGLQENKRLLPHAKQRTLDAIDKALAACDVCKVGQIYPIATEAFRLAENGEDFRLKIKRELNLDFIILTGDEEAELALDALKIDFSSQLDNALIIDIGGGSTEVSTKCEGNVGVCGSKPVSSNFELQKSLPMGCVVLKEEYLLTDPPTEEEIVNLRTHIKSMISDLPVSEISLHCFGIGGTCVTLGSIQIGEFKAEKIHGMQLSYRQIEDISSQMNSLTIQERRALPGMIMGREDILPAGAIVLMELMSHFNTESITISTHGIRHGYLHKINLS